MLCSLTICPEVGTLTQATAWQLDGTLPQTLNATAGCFHESEQQWHGTVIAKQLIAPRNDSAHCHEHRQFPPITALLFLPVCRLWKTTLIPAQIQKLYCAKLRARPSFCFKWKLNRIHFIRGDTLHGTDQRISPDDSWIWLKVDGWTRESFIAFCPAETNSAPRTVLAQHTS